MNFNNEIIDGQSTVAENLAKTNRNFMLLKEILGSGASSQDIQNILNTISQTYVKTADIVNNLTSTATNKPVSALQAKNLKQDITNLTQQLQQLNQNVSNLTQQLNNKVEIITQDLSLRNNWQNETYMQPAKIHKFGKLVFLTGVIKGGTKAKYTTIFDMPSGFAPDKVAYFMTASLFADKVYRIDFQTNGAATIQSDNMPDYIVLNGANWIVV